MEIQSKQRLKAKLGATWRVHGWERVVHSHPSKEWEIIECLTATFENIQSRYKEEWPAQRLNNHVSGNAKVATSVPMDVITDFLKLENFA